MMEFICLWHSYVYGIHVGHGDTYKGIWDIETSVYFTLLSIGVPVSWTPVLSLGLSAAKAS